MKVSKEIIVNYIDEYSLGIFEEGECLKAKELFSKHNFGKNLYNLPFMMMEEIICSIEEGKMKLKYYKDYDCFLNQNSENVKNDQIILPMNDLGRTEMYSKLLYNNHNTNFDPYKTLQSINFYKYSRQNGLISKRPQNEKTDSVIKKIAEDYKINEKKKIESLPTLIKSFEILAKKYPVFLVSKSKAKHESCVIVLDTEDLVKDIMHVALAEKDLWTKKFKNVLLAIGSYSGFSFYSLYNEIKSS